MRTVLLTGFEPFADDPTNPSGAAVRLVAEAWTGPERLVTAVFPVAFASAADALRALIDEHSPDLVIATGLAGGRTAVTPERVAINLIDARIPDNAGAQPSDAPSIEGAPAAYFATLPVKAIVQNATAAGIPSTVSTTAGTCVWNHVFYQALHAAQARPGMRAGFVHVPYAAESAPAGAFALPLADIARALELAVRTSLDTAKEVGGIGGSLH